MEKKYPNFYKETGYGTATGLCGINCRHSFHPYYPGSARTYSQEQLNAWKNEKVTYNGKEYSKYDATQIQRKMERQIRKDKKELAGFQGILTSNLKDKKLLEDTRTEFARRSLIYKSHQNELDDFITQTLLNKDNARLYIGQQNKNLSVQVASVTKIANRYNKEIVGIKVNGVEVKEVGEHIISRTYARNIKFEDVLDTLKNPVKYGNIRKDKSQQIKGENCTVVLNIETGKLITVYPQKTRRESEK